MGTGFRGLHFLPIREKAELSPKKIETECGGEDGRRPGTSRWLRWGKAGGRGALPFPRDKLQRKPPWAEPRTKKGSRD